MSKGFLALVIVLLLIFASYLGFTILAGRKADQDILSDYNIQVNNIKDAFIKTECHEAEKEETNDTSPTSEGEERSLSFNCTVDTKDWQSVNEFGLLFKIPVDWKVLRHSEDEFERLTFLPPTTVDGYEGFTVEKFFADKAGFPIKYSSQSECHTHYKAIWIGREIEVLEQASPADKSFIKYFIEDIGSYDIEITRAFPSVHPKNKKLSEIYEIEDTIMCGMEIE